MGWNDQQQWTSDKSWTYRGQGKRANYFKFICCTTKGCPGWLRESRIAEPGNEACNLCHAPWPGKTPAGAAIGERIAAKGVDSAISTKVLELIAKMEGNEGIKAEAAQLLGGGQDAIGKEPPKEVDPTLADLQARTTAAEKRRKHLENTADQQLSKVQKIRDDLVAAEIKLLETSTNAEVAAADCKRAAEEYNDACAKSYQGAGRGKSPAAEREIDRAEWSKDETMAEKIEKLDELERQARAAKDDLFREADRKKEDKQPPHKKAKKDGGGEEEEAPADGEEDQQMGDAAAASDANGSNAAAIESAAVAAEQAAERTKKVDALIAEAAAKSRG